jgi:hypothetical protein
MRREGREEKAGVLKNKKAALIIVLLPVRSRR